MYPTTYTVLVMHFSFADNVIINLIHPLPPVYPSQGFPIKVRSSLGNKV